MTKAQVIKELKEMVKFFEQYDKCPYDNEKELAAALKQLIKELKNGSSTSKSNPTDNRLGRQLQRPVAPTCKKR
jgi:hypothetical protein